MRPEELLNVRSDLMPQDGSFLDAMLPEWVYKSIHSKLDNPGLLDKKKINIQKCFNPITSRSLILAYANTSKNDAALVIFENFDGKYRETFSVKSKLILSVQTHLPNIVMVCLDESGIGTATVNFHVIRCVKDGYKFVWQGLANFYTYNYYPDLCFEVIAGISFSNTGELVHSILKKLFKEDNPANPVNFEKLFDIYIYNEDNAKYQFVKRL